VIGIQVMGIDYWGCTGLDLLAPPPGMGYPRPSRRPWPPHGSPPRSPSPGPPRSSSPTWGCTCPLRMTTTRMPFGKNEVVVHRLGGKSLRTSLTSRHPQPDQPPPQSKCSDIPPPKKNYPGPNPNPTSSPPPRAPPPPPARRGEYLGRRWHPPPGRAFPASRPPRRGRSPGRSPGRTPGAGPARRGRGGSIKATLGHKRRKRWSLFRRFTTPVAS